ncbi:hypothetical protein ACFQJD_15625 [Haloplanus sp. GCM10025708]|uniref:hypothetical protein n=1 Tax=Haloferacaceae TaxID=1644056 RepID=UPI003614D8B2
MIDQSNLDSATLAERLALLGVVAASRDGTPVNSADVNAVCDGYLDAVDGDVLGDVSEGEVIRALNRLEADGFLTQERVDGASGVGKGRPAYALAGDADELLDALAEDGRVAGVVSRVRGLRE